MSGIFGVFNSDDRPAPGSDCTVWADATLYYRDELCRALGLSPNEALDDAGLILEAYRKWGEACVEHLYGDFAFAILNPATNTLFCARDHFGMRPFYYHHSGTRFVFASDARDIFAVPEVPYAINEGRVADFIVPELEWIDYTSTFYEGVYRLPPGNKVTGTIKGLRVSEYWAPQLGPHPGPMSDDDWREGFLEVFSNAVEERLRSPVGRVGSMVSGGIDSGSVAAIANDFLKTRGEHPIRTFSAAQPPSIDCAESQRIRASIDYLGATGTQIFPDDIAELDDELHASIEEPYDASFLFMRAIFHAAAKDGMQALLDGGSGDVVLNEGSYVIRLARRGHVAGAFHEVIAGQSFWEDSSVVPEMARLTARAMIPEFLKSAIRPYRQRRDARHFVSTSLISSELAELTNIAERCESMYEMFPTDWTSYEHERLRKIRPNVSAGRERYARLAASADMEARDPFLDRRLIDFCAHLPGHLLLRDGWPKAILRDVMADRLPAEVCRGKGRPHIGWVFTHKFLEREKSRGNLTQTGLTEALAGYVDSNRLDRAWSTFENGIDAGPIHTAYVLCLWLRQTASRPVVKNQPFGYSSAIEQ